MRKTLGTFALVLGIGLAGGLTVPPAAAQSGSIPVPDQDPWYAPPAGYNTLPNGGFIRARTVSSGSFQNQPLNVWQVLYKSSDSHNQPTTSVVTVVVPQAAWTGGGPRPVVAYTEAEDALSTSCSPSYTIRTGTDMEGPSAVQTAQQKGYAVLIPDYEGPDSRWIDGRQAGQSTLDGIRAALSYAPAGLSRSAPVGVIGYSGGGGAAGWTAAVKQSYAPELNVVGASVGAASNADIEQVWGKHDGTVTVGLLVMAVNGLRKGYPEAGINDYLTASGRSLIDGANGACIKNDVYKWSGTGTLEPYTISPSVMVPKSAPGSYILNKNSLSLQSVAPNFPVQVFNDRYDELIPTQASINEAKNWCNLGSSVQMIITATPTPAIASVHVSAMTQWSQSAFSFLDSRFKGQATTNSCPDVATWSNPYSYGTYPSSYGTYP